MIDREIIQKLIEEELADANSKFPLFNSNHEACAVINEEIEEIGAEYGGVWEAYNAVWENTKADDSVQGNALKGRDAAIRLVQEAIQVAAMFQKAVTSEGARCLENI